MGFKITKKEILKLASNADVYRRGYRYYEENRVGGISYEDKCGQITVMASVDGNYKDYGVKANFDASGILTSFHCNCEAYTMWKGACKHVVCLLLKIHEDTLVREKKDAAEHYAEEIIHAFEQKMRQSVNYRLQSRAPEGDVRVLPCLCTDERRRLSLTFSLGNGSSRMYVIKNITEFIENVQSENCYSYGKELEFKHSLAMFDRQSMALVQFIAQSLTAYDDAFGLAIGGNRDGGKYLFLSGKDFDEFFTQWEGENVEADLFGFDEEYLTFLAKDPDIAFTVEIDNEMKRAAMTWEKIDYYAFKGYQYGYFACGGNLYRMEKDSCDALVTAIAHIDQAEKAVVVFEGKQYQAFMSVVLPQLAAMGMVRLQPELSMVVEKLTGKIYLDMVKKDVTAKVVFAYGDTECLPGEDLNQAILRDSVKEYEILRQLSIYGFMLGEKGLYVLGDGDGIYSFLRGGIQELQDLAEVYVTDSFTRKTSAVAGKISFSATIEGNLLEMSVETAGYSMLELFDAVNSYNMKKRYHRFKDGSMLDLDDPDAKLLSDMVNSLGIGKKDIAEGKIKVPQYRALYVDNIFRQDSQIQMAGDLYFNSFLEKVKKGTGAPVDMPSSLAPVLREYQKDGVRWLAQLTQFDFGGILADDMGLGKTLQMIALLLIEKEQGHARAPSLVVAPTSLMYNWQNEIARFAPALKTVVLSGTPAKRQALFETSPDADVLITTYDLMKRDIEFYGEQEFHMVIADEAQYIKNPVTQNARAIKKLKSRHRFALTGTPIENSLTELWSIFDFIMPGYLYTSAKFGKLYEGPIVKEEDQEAAEKLKKQTAPFILRRIKKDVLTELPEKTETTLYADLTGEQRKLYIASFLKAKGEFERMGLEEGLGRNKMAVIAQLTRLRQLCCHPSLFMEGYRGGSGKLDITMETIEQAIDSGHRILLFSQFTAMLAIIKKKLDLGGYAYFYLDGATPAQERAQMAEQFNQGERALFLVSLKAGGTGLNLIGADIVIHYDQWWNPAVMSQASDRAHRFGQKRAVQVYNIVAKDTIEEKVLALQEKKKDLIEAVIEKGGSLFSAMSEEEIMTLFQ